MPIKVNPRAQVSPAFLALYERVVHEFHQYYLEEMVSMNEYAQRSHKAAYASTIQRIDAILKGIRQPGVGMDLEMSRLRSLPYQKLDVLSNDGVDWFCGLTQDLPMIEFARGKPGTQYNTATQTSARWNTGPYWVFIPSDQLRKIDDYHLIPDRNKKIASRHPHHYAIPDPKDRGPLYMRPAWCWATFGGAVTTMADDVNVPEIFRLMQRFATTFNAGSPLRNPKLYPEMKGFMTREECTSN